MGFLSATAAVSREATGLHLQLDEAQAAVVEHVTFTGRSIWVSVMKSPSIMAKPPSPDIEITWRPLCEAWAPIACGMALAIEAWLNEPISRRLPFILM